MKPRTYNVRDERFRSFRDMTSRIHFFRPKRAGPINHPYNKGERMQANR